MKPVRFDYCRAETVADAVGLMAELGEDAAVLAGGMTLGPMLNLRMVRPRAVIDIGRVAALRSIEVRDRILLTGATSVQADALASPLVAREVPLLALALPWVGHFQTRNRGTLGGSVAHADPSAEIPLCLVVTGGVVVLRGRRERRVPAQNFFLGALTTARRPDELLVGLEWPCAPADAGHAFEEIAQRHGDFAIAAAACQVRLTASRSAIEVLSLGLGGVDSRPVAIETSAFLGRPADATLAADIADHAARSVTPMEDHVADAEYRLALARVLVERVVPRAIADARARRGPP